MLARLNGLEHNPISNFMHLQSEMDRLFEAAGVRRLHNSAKQAEQPPINIGATPEQIDLFLSVPGIDPAEVNISIDKHQLTISGTRSVKNSDEVTSVIKERFAGDFKYLVTLPDDADPERVEAHYREGVLHLNIKRRKASNPRQIIVQ